MTRRICARMTDEKELPRMYGRFADDFPHRVVFTFINECPVLLNREAFHALKEQWLADHKLQKMVDYYPGAYVVAFKDPALQLLMYLELNEAAV